LKHDESGNRRVLEITYADDLDTLSDWFSENHSDTIYAYNDGELDHAGELTVFEAATALMY
jgi:hypothetical protein